MKFSVRLISYARSFTRLATQDMLPADGTSGPGYMFFATPAQKAKTLMYAQTLAQTADLYIKAGLKALPDANAIAAATAVDAHTGCRGSLGRHCPGQCQPSLAVDRAACASCTPVSLALLGIRGSGDVSSMWGDAAACITGPV